MNYLKSVEANASSNFVMLQNAVGISIFVEKQSCLTVEIKSENSGLLTFQNKGVIFEVNLVLQALTVSLNGIPATPSTMLLAVQKIGECFFKVVGGGTPTPETGLPYAVRYFDTEGRDTSSVAFEYNNNNKTLYIADAAFGNHFNVPNQMGVYSAISDEVIADFNATTNTYRYAHGAIKSTPTAELEVTGTAKINGLLDVNDITNGYNKINTAGRITIGDINNTTNISVRGIFDEDAIFYSSNQGHIFLGSILFESLLVTAAATNKMVVIDTDTKVLGFMDIPAGGGTPTYLVFTAQLFQTGTNDPTVNILENTLGFTPVFTRQSAGEYRIIISEFQIPLTKRWCSFSRGTTTANFFIENSYFSFIRIFSSGGPFSGDGMIDNQCIEIRKYL